MSLKKILKRRCWTKAALSGQALFEYFILLVVLAAVTIVGTSTFMERIRRSSDKVFNYSTTKMKQQNLGSFDTGSIIPDLDWTI